MTQTDVDQWAAWALHVAAEAKNQGQGFLELQLEVGTSQQKTDFSATGVVGHRGATSHGGLLSAVEQIGWHLEHVNYVFTPTHQKTHKAFLGGENAAISGVVMGIYLFRVVDTALSLHGYCTACGRALTEHPFCPACGLRREGGAEDARPSEPSGLPQPPGAD